MPARGYDTRSEFSRTVPGKLLVLALALLVASGCVRVRRGWLLNLNLSLEWNRIPWRAGPDGHYEVQPPDCVACLHYPAGHRCPRCAGGPGFYGAAAPAGAGSQAPVLQPPGKLQAVPTQPAWPEDTPRGEEVPDSGSGAGEPLPAEPDPSGKAPASEAENAAPLPAPEPPPQAASWYGRQLSRPWVFRTSQATDSPSHRSVRLEREGRRVY